MKTLNEQTVSIINQIEKLNESELIDLNNTYCQSINNTGSEIFENNEEFFAMFYPNAGDGLKVAQGVFYGNYNYSDKYVTFNGYGNLESFDYMDTDKLYERVTTMAEYIIENENEFSHLLDFFEVNN